MSSSVMSSAGTPSREQALHGAHDLLAAAVVERDVQDQAGVVAGQLDGGTHAVRQARLNAFERAHVPNLHVVAMELGSFAYRCAAASSRIRPKTSSAGRRQFSVENA